MMKEVRTLCYSIFYLQKINKMFSIVIALYFIDRGEYSRSVYDIFEFLLREVGIVLGVSVQSVQEM